jgi:hypothetical protein
MSQKNDLRKKINPKAISALIMEDSSRSGAPDFIKKAYNLVFVNPDKLTDEWVKRINRWAKNTVKDMSLDSEFETPKKGAVLSNLGPLTIKKMIMRHSKKETWSGERFFDYIAVDENGWKYWFRLFRYTRDLDAKKAFFPRRGQKILIESARVRENRTGITFLAQVRDVQVLKKKE